MEINQEAKDIWLKYVTLMGESSGLQAKEKFLQIRQSFYNYVINVPEGNVKNLDLTKGFYLIPENRLKEFYDCETGFKH